MSPHRHLSTSSHRHPTQIQEIFLGIGLQLHDKALSSFIESKSKGGTSGEDDSAHESKERTMEYSMVLHDGTGVLESETYYSAIASDGSSEEVKKEAVKGFSREVLGRILDLQKSKSMDVRVVAAAEPIPDILRQVKGIEWMASVWLHLDAIPFMISPATTMFDRLPAPSTQASATSAVSAAIKYLHPATHSATVAETSSEDHHVLVDCDEKVRLCSLLQYEQSSSPEVWNRFCSLARHLLSHSPRIAFFSATPQGGGVALMRHALIRLWRMVGLDVSWYVPEGHPVVFDVTKRKYHNTLQGVAPKGTELEEDEKRWFEIWTEQNHEAFWTKGAIDADLIVIDDPQLAALIPIIKKKRPNAKIIFRSHIQIQADLTDDPSTSQYRTWNYLFSFIKHTDLFLAHPVKQFVPKNVHETLPVLYMAPSTDPLDGLNKPYGTSSIHYYRQYFNSLASKQGGNSISWDRGYICQIARFDPSKGIEYLLEAYLQFRQRLNEMDAPPRDGGPQLIIMGHGSVDDPDGTVIYEKCHDIIASEEYQLVKSDVAIVRAPPSDSLLGAILQGAWVATQLSTREGFEVKVTEAVNRRVPIIASDAGGIPLQVKHGSNGWIVPSANSRAVSDLLFQIYTGEVQIERPVPSSLKLRGKDDPNSVAEAFVRDLDKPMLSIREEGDKSPTSEDFWTVGNAIKWMYLGSRTLGYEPEYAEDVKGEKGMGILKAAEGLGEGVKAVDGVKGEKGWVEMLEMDEGRLRGMGVGKGSFERGTDEVGRNVWELVMGEDLVEGDGAVRDHQ